MKTKFRGYYRIHKKDLLLKFENCLFVFDANALLDIFRLNKSLTEQVFNVMENYSEQIRIPYHAAEEYNNRINDVLIDQYNKIKKAKNNFKSFEESLNAKRNQPYISDKTAELINKLKSQIEEDFGLQIEYILNELLYGEMQNKMADLLDNKVLEPFTKDEIDKLKEKGQKRYAEKIPPGWKDASKSENRYGDYINWEEILRLAVNEKKSIIFITNDTKSDWIEEIEGKKIGPLHALSQEFCERVNNADQLFYIYTLDKFLEFTQDHNKTLDSPKTIIENVKNILQESTAFEIGSNSKMNIETSHSNKESGPEAEKVSSSDEYKIKSEPVKSEPVKSEPAQSEPVKGEPAKSEPVKDEPAKGEPVKGEPVKDEPAKDE